LLLDDFPPRVDHSLVAMSVKFSLATAIVTASIVLVAATFGHCSTIPLAKSDINVYNLQPQYSNVKLLDLKV
jgi:hypothetical protein